VTAAGEGEAPGSATSPGFGPFVPNAEVRHCPAQHLVAPAVPPVPPAHASAVPSFASSAGGPVAARAACTASFC
jgi:hypothetical protein